MTREEAINEINKVFTPAYANYIVTALTEGATVSDIQHRWGRAYEAGMKDGLEQEQGTAGIQAIYTEALEEGIRCAMCTNTIKSDTGCDGGCIVDTKMYNKVMAEINSRLLRKPPQEGHWIDIKNKNGTVIATRCSRCGNSPKHAIKSDFCPNCGADMRGGKRMTLEEHIEKRRERVANMTLAQARDLIAKTLSHSDMGIEFDKAVQMLLDCADEKINSGWIPVTERLPEEGQFVIVSFSCNASDYSRKRVVTAWYHKEYGFTCGITDAWMPLPKPYKAESEKT